ncbi:hypothetical protein TrRE_jg8386, partial [Triparma retinervis]
SPGSVGSDVKFQMIDQDTGEVYDIRDLESAALGSGEGPSGMEVGYTLMPSKRELMERKSTGGAQDSDDESSTTNGSGSKGKGVKSFFKGMKSKIKSSNHSQDTSNLSSNKSPNHVPVKVTKKDHPEFQDLLLLTVIPPCNEQGEGGAHKGPIWVMRFSTCGRYMATGGADNAIRIWEVNRVVKDRSKSRGGSSESDDDSVASVSSRQSERGRRRKKKKKGTKDVPSNLKSDPPSDHPRHRAKPGEGEVAGEIDLFSGPPIRTYKEHTADVIDLSWSKTTFLLSASLDKTVRLWHVSRSECLHLFQHSDFVTAVDFHPVEDRYFLSGGFDKKLRIWSIPDGRVKEWAQAPEMVTAARFTPNGLMVVAGLYHGQVYFYSTDGMRYYTQVDARNRHGSQRGGKKVTGLNFLRGGTTTERGTMGSESARQSGSSRSSRSSRDSSRDSRDSRDSRSSTGLGRSSSDGSGSSFSERRSAMFLEQLLITTNDSRLRLVGMDDYSQVMKFKGLVNSSMQISASFSESGDYIVAGSEDGRAYIWNRQQPQNRGMGLLGGHKDKGKNKSYESFEATHATPPIVTSALFVPPRSLRNCFLSCGCMDGGSNFDTSCDLSAGMVVTSDYDGAVRVYLKQTVYEEIVEANKIDLGGLTVKYNEMGEQVVEGPTDVGGKPEEGMVGGGLGLGMTAAF